MLYKTVEKLKSILESTPVDWQAFDEVLSSVNDINLLDEDAEETLLSEFICGADFYHNGSEMPKAVKHFLVNGYDVKAHEGRNGELALSQLCWSSYDMYILDTAKVLLDAGALVTSTTWDDDQNDESTSVMGSLEWKLPGAWVVDKDYTWANVLEAYYSIIKAAAQGKDYHGINCFLVCLGKKLTGVSISASEDGTTSIIPEESITTFNESLIFEFEGVPLVVRKYIDFVVDPITAEEFGERLLNVNGSFASVIGSTLVDIQYINQSTCYMDFDNGGRIILTSFDCGQDRTGAFEITTVKKVDLEELEVDWICRWNSCVYASTVTEYEEEAMALISDTNAYLLYTKPIDNSSYGISAIKCNRRLMRDFKWKLPIQKPDRIRVYHKRGNATALRFECGKENLYLKTSEYVGFEICLSHERVNPNEIYSLDALKGKHMEFKRISP